MKTTKSNVKEAASRPEHKTVEQFIMTSKAHRQFLERKLNKTGIYRSQHQILMCIARNPNISQKELAGIYNVSTAAVTVSLKKLEKNGLIVRMVNESDNRYNTISLTERGHEIVESNFAFFVQTEEKMFSDFSLEEIAQFTEYLRRIRKNLQQMEGE